MHLTVTLYSATLSYLLLVERTSVFVLATIEIYDLWKCFKGQSHRECTAWIFLMMRGYLADANAMSSSERNGSGLFMMFQVTFQNRHMRFLKPWWFYHEFLDLSKWPKIEVRLPTFTDFQWTLVFYLLCHWKCPSEVTYPQWKAYSQPILFLQILSHFCTLLLSQQRWSEQWQREHIKRGLKWAGNRRSHQISQ